MNELIIVLELPVWVSFPLLNVLLRLIIKKIKKNFKKIKSKKKFKYSLNLKFKMNLLIYLSENYERKEERF